MSNLRTLRNPACGKLCQLEEGIVSGGGRNNLNDFRIAAVTSLISLGIRVELRERGDELIFHTEMCIAVHWLDNPTHVATGRPRRATSSAWTLLKPP